jgi:hypothetical protein
MLQQQTSPHLAPAHTIQPQPAMVLRPAVQLQTACRKPQQLLQEHSSSSSSSTGDGGASNTA